MDPDLHKRNYVNEAIQTYHKIHCQQLPAEASYILDCLAEEVRRDVRATTDNVREMPEGDLLAAIKRHAVLQRAISARKMELYSLRQEDGEPVRKFYARIQHLARQCQLTVPCPANDCTYHVAPFVSYADEIVKQVVLVGLVDQEIKKDVLGTTKLTTSRWPRP